MPWPSQAPDLNLIERLRDNLEQHLRQRFPLPSTKREMIDFLVEAWCCNPPVGVNRLSASRMVVLATHGGPALLSDYLSFQLRSIKVINSK